jgi:hypothetical protein
MKRVRLPRFRVLAPAPPPCRAIAAPTEPRPVAGRQPRALERPAVHLHFMAWIRRTWRRSCRANCRDRLVLGHR